MIVPYSFMFHLKIYEVDRINIKGIHGLFNKGCKQYTITLVGGNQYILSLRNFKANFKNEGVRILEICIDVVVPYSIMFHLKKNVSG